MNRRSDDGAVYSQDSSFLLTHGSRHGSRHEETKAAAALSGLGVGLAVELVRTVRKTALSGRIAQGELSPWVGLRYDRRRLQSRCGERVGDGPLAQLKVLRAEHHQPVRAGQHLSFVDNQSDEYVVGRNRDDIVRRTPGLSS